MKDLIKKLGTLSGLTLSEKEIRDFSEDFSDIIPLIDKISDFPETESYLVNTENFDNLRSDVVKNDNISFDTKTVPKVIS